MSHKFHFSEKANDIVILTEKGHLINYQNYKYDRRNFYRYPQLHSELQAGSITDCKVTPNYILLLTKKGELFEGQINN